MSFNEKAYEAVYDEEKYNIKAGEPPSLRDFVERYEAAKASDQPGDCVSDLHSALKLMWFFLPMEEPDPHSKKKDVVEKNKRWKLACDLYQKHFSSIPNQSSGCTSCGHTFDGHYESCKWSNKRELVNQEMLDFIKDLAGRPKEFGLLGAWVDSAKRLLSKIEVDQ